VKRYAILNLLAAVVAAGLAALTADPFASEVGVLASAMSAAAVFAMLAFSAKSPTKGAQWALGAISVSFLFRLLLLGGGVALMVFQKHSTTWFVVGFFAPYVAFQILEVAFVNSQARQRMGNHALKSIVIAGTLLVAPFAQASEAHGEESIGDAMIHHIADTHVMEVPGICDGWHWNCEIDLREVFGDKLVFQVGSVKVDMTPTKNVVMMWIVAFLLLVLFIVAVRKRAVVPRGLYNALEMLVQFVRNELAIPNIGKRDADRFVPFLCTAFFFILFMNLIGLVPWSGTATANINVTVCLAVFTFLVTQFAAIRAQGIGGYLKHLTGGVPYPALWIIMIPVEFIGLFTKPFALTVRLFANMVAGHFVILALLGLILVMKSPLIAFGAIPLALMIFVLELFVAFVQAYIFTMLSALFIGAGLVHHEPHGHEDSHGHDKGGHGPKPTLGESAG
jgi:F-type H+-transporting ATPase subunit a